MLRHGSTFKTLATSAAFVALLLIPPCATAVTFVVNSKLDQPDDLTMPGTCHTAAGTCTLRAAVMQANLTSGIGATITLPAGTYLLTIPSTPANGVEVGDLNLTTPSVGSPTITIAGAGSSTTIIDANQLDRAFDVQGGRTATISGVTIKNGFTSTGVGGGIVNDGTLTLDSVVVSDNHLTSLSQGGGIYSDFSATLTVTRSTIILNVAGTGGGICSAGTLTVSDSTISQNITSTYGGGIATFTDTQTTVTGSTINNNAAGEGGGLFSNGMLTMVNSTISLNDATHDGGGIYVGAGIANIYSSTIVSNTADSDADEVGSGGGIYNYSSGTVQLRNDLVAANNVSNSPTYRDCAGTIGTIDMNLFWDTTGCNLASPPSTWTLLNSLGLVDGLKNNGGPTKTHALLPGSNAIDGGNTIYSGCIGPDNNFLPTDQRGFTRVSGVRCDIGAYEVSDTIFVGRFE
jgi:hypothetical protein